MKFSKIDKCRVVVGERELFPETFQKAPCLIVLEVFLSLLTFLEAGAVAEQG